MKVIDLCHKISMNVDKVFDKELFFPLNKSFKKHIGEYYSPFKIKNLLEELDQLIINKIYNLLNIIFKSKSF